MPISDPDKKRAYQAEWRARNRERHADQTRRAKLKQKYGLTQEDYDRMVSDQGGQCAICPKTEPGGRGAWHVDHDHATGEVRGLLCAACNRALGLLGDDIDILRRAVEYLDR